jgi:hypothetical protein
MRLYKNAITFIMAHLLLIELTIKLPLEPVFRFLRPGTIGITGFQEIIGGFRKSTRLFIRAAIASGPDRKVQCFGHAGVSGASFRPFNSLTTQIVGR